jgi:hypothetical protein
VQCGLITAEVSTCANPYSGVSCFENTTWTTTSPATLGFRSSVQTADLTYSILNNSIVQATNFSPSTAQNITPSEYLDSLQAVFGPQYDSGVSTDPNSVFQCWIRQDSLLFAQDEVTAAAYADGLAEVLTYPLLLFQPGTGIWDPPGPEYTVPIELAQTHTVPSISFWAVLVYIAVVGLIFIWSIGGLLLSLFIDASPATSSFDVVDFAAGVTTNRSDGSLAETLASLPFGKDAEIRKLFEDKAVYVRNMTGGESESD